VLAAEAEAFAAFKQKWTLKLARALATGFASASAAYRRRSSFEAFAAQGAAEGRCVAPGLVPLLCDACRQHMPHTSPSRSRQG
jgi:hypothetical protein